MTALLLGSISTLSDTSELQREAFNAAFAAQGLDWHWKREDYQKLLTGNGGQQRITDYAEERGEEVDAQAVHDAKSKIFQERFAADPLEARPGVVDAVKAARAAGWRTALVTTTSRANVSALLENVEGLDESDFDVVLDSSDVEQPKPDPAAYAVALERLGEEPGACVAVEDNVGGVEAATAAGIAAVAFPNENTSGHDFGDAPVVDRLDLDQLATHVASA